LLLAYLPQSQCFYMHICSMDSSSEIYCQVRSWVIYGIPSRTGKQRRGSIVFDAHHHQSSSVSYPQRNVEPHASCANDSSNLSCIATASSSDCSCASAAVQLRQHQGSALDCCLKGETRIEIVVPLLRTVHLPPLCGKYHRQVHFGVIPCPVLY